MMCRMIRVFVALISATVLGVAQTAPDATELRRLLQEFLSGAARNDAAIHERFWADDLIYTGSSGRRTGKADIVTSVRAAPPTQGQQSATYSAEDVRIQQYGDTAVVAFRLVATMSNNGRAEVARFLNTGTFLKRNGKWQVVSWQATKMPRSEDDAKASVFAAHDAFHRALLAADTKALEPALDKAFTWTDTAGRQLNRDQLIGQIRSGAWKYSTLDTRDVAIRVYGDTAVVNGLLAARRSAESDAFKESYTMTFANIDNRWVAVALHSSPSN
jgi:ketosteroid isomerase-like protein